MFLHLCSSLEMCSPWKQMLAQLPAIPAPVQKVLMAFLAQPWLE